MTKRKWFFQLEFMLILAIAIGILLRIINLGSREFWYDEVLSLLLSTGQKTAYQTPGNIPISLTDYKFLLSLPNNSNLLDLGTIKNFFKGLVGGEPHPPLFFLSQHLWLRLFGNSEAAMRSLGAILSIGAIGSSYGLGRFILGHRGGLILAALLATNPFYLFHSLNVRMYGSLVLWTTLSGWALLKLVYSQDSETKENRQYQLFWNLVLIGSVAAGLLTFYLFAYWLIALAALAIYLQPQQWRQHGLRLGSAILLTMPWVIWGTRQQIRNADINRFAASTDFVSAGVRHLQDVVQVLGVHLLIGDWVTSLPTIITVIFGTIVLALIITCIISLWRNGERTLLNIALLMGILPLLLALTVDTISGKYTLGFGEGRAMIIILPGCLFLLAVFLEKISWQWKGGLAAILLFIYLSISTGDYTLRHRSMFNQISNLIQQQANAPTLIILNSKAWGHVMRLAYYIPNSTRVDLFASAPQELVQSLESFSASSDFSQYSQFLWLESQNTVWSKLKTDEEKNNIRIQTEKILSSRLKLKDTKLLLGTMDIDNFTAKLYTR